MKPSAGAVTIPPITTPSPSVEISRNFDRGYRSSGVAGGTVGGGSDGAAAAAVSGATSGAWTSSLPFVRSRTQRNANASAISAPSPAIHQETTSPTRRTTTPTAKPTGHKLGPGTCGWSSW